MKSSNFITLLDVANKGDHFRHLLVGGFFHFDFVFTQVTFYLRPMPRVKKSNQASFSPEWFELSIHKDIRIPYRRV